MSGHCRVMVAELNEALANGLAEEIAEADITHAPVALRVICNALTPASAAEARDEFTSLPQAFLLTVVECVTDAYEAGKPFEMISEPPEKRIDAARNGRVEWRIVYDEEGVKMIVSHVHGHHAAWFTNTEAVVT